MRQIEVSAGTYFRVWVMQETPPNRESESRWCSNFQLLVSAKRSSGQSGAVSYQRRFTLPEDAQAEDITARSHHGVLEISIGKTPKVQPRRITVEAA